MGGRAYVLGGYDGKKPIDSVLATQNGSSFTQVARLPVPARYLAVAALGGRIYAFGGLTASGARQRRDPRNRPAERQRQRSSAICRKRSPTPAPSRSADSIYVLGGDRAARRAIGSGDMSRASRTVGRRRPPAPPIAGAGAAVIGSTGYLIGGTGPGETPLRTVLTLQD